MTGRPRVPLVVRRRFWRLIVGGWATKAAARAVGVSTSVAERWFAEAGGMPPVDLCEPSGRYLSLAEREEIAVGVAVGLSVRAVARLLGRAPSTVSRELARNRPADGRGYRAHLAQHKAETRARRPKPTKLTCRPALRALVQRMLEERHSPQQIAERLRRVLPNDRESRVSHETIYRALYVQGRGELRRELTACLRTGRALRCPRRRAGAAPRARIPDMVMISERPAEADDRAVPGHWEGDLIIGANHASAIGTLVERTTRFVLLLHLPNGRTAEAVREAMTTAIATLPAALRRSVTWDQGSELAEHAQFSVDTGVPVYFCDPHSPWQRGTNENTNGLLRQYFPKGTDLAVHTPEHLQAVADQLNRRPRKTLDYATPAETLNQLLSTPTKPTGVATAP